MLDNFENIETTCLKLGDFDSLGDTRAIYNDVEISVFGGTGYLGHILVPMLLDKGYEVNVIDTQWYGNKLKSHRNLKIYKEKRCMVL